MKWYEKMDHFIGGDCILCRKIRNYIFIGGIIALVLNIFMWASTMWTLHLLLETIALL